MHDDVIKAQAMMAELVDEDLKELAKSQYLDPFTVPFIQLLRNSQIQITGVPVRPDCDGPGGGSWNEHCGGAGGGNPNLHKEQHSMHCCCPECISPPRK